MVLSTVRAYSSYTEIFRRFESGQFVVKDHVGSFNAVAPGMKFEQSIQRASKIKGGIVGNTRKTTVVVEWQFILMRFFSFAIT